MTVKNTGYVVILGGAAMDITGVPTAKFVLGDSIPGVVKTSMGGVGRNIGENLARLGLPVKLLTALGDDPYGRKITADCTALGMDLSHAQILKDESTAIYLAVLDETGDMKTAIASMDILRRIDIDFVKQHAALIRGAAVVVVDANLSRETIEYVASTFGDCFLFVDLVSANKAEKLRQVIGAFHTVKPNKIEAQALSDTKTDDQAGLIKAKDWFIAQGVKRVYISLGQEGVFYGDAAHWAHRRIKPVAMKSATGAGDAFMAGLVYGFVRQLSMPETVAFAQVMASLTVTAESTIYPHLSEATVLAELEAVSERSERKDEH